MIMYLMDFLEFLTTAFLMDDNGIWRVSPAYDLTFSSGPSGEHHTTIMGEGKHPGMSHLIKLATLANIPQNKAKLIISEVKEAISEWNQLASSSHVSSKSIKMIQKELSKIM